MSPYRIRLKGPWEYKWLSHSDEQSNVAASEVGFPLTGRVRMPATWREMFGEQSGRATFRRHFQKPTNLDPHESVSIACDGVGGTGRVALNGRELGPVALTDHTFRFEITPLLQPRNELVVELAFDPDLNSKDAGGLWGFVAIEILAEQRSAEA